MCVRNQHIWLWLKKPEFQNGLPDRQVDTWTKTCGLPLLSNFEPHPYVQWSWAETCHTAEGPPAELQGLAPGSRSGGMRHRLPNAQMGKEKGNSCFWMTTRSSRFERSEQGTFFFSLVYFPPLPHRISPPPSSPHPPLPSSPHPPPMSSSSSLRKRTCFEVMDTSSTVRAR